MTREKRRLGQGLAALLGSTFKGDESEAEEPQTLKIHHEIADEQPSTDAPESERDTIRLNVYEIDNNPFQPRRDFSEPEIASLAESLKEHDILQPVLVRRAGERYQLISGERRLRAAIRAGWSTIPARIRDADDRLVAELAIVENLQRQDLNPLEKALSFKRYLDQHNCPQEDLAKRLKIDRSTIANLVRLLELPEHVQQNLRDGSLSAGHARALLPLGDDLQQVDFAKRIIDEGLSVRATERLVSETIQSEDGGTVSIEAAEKAKAKRTRSDQIASLEQEFRIALGTKVEIRLSKRGVGKITIQFANHDEFERLREYIVDDGEHLQSDVA